LVHSWNGKYRRPAGLWTPDYRTPMQTNLLWVYEGQTSYWDLVLGARSGLQTADMVLGEWARAAASYALQPGRQWRSVEDTAFDPIAAARKPKPFASWQRREDYYVEGSLVWLEADMTIRELTRGKRSLDDFARSFFGGRDGDWGQRTYGFGDVVAALNAVAPYDWASFLDQRIRTPGQAPPLAGFEKGGYTLIYREEPNIHDRQREMGTNSLDLSFSLGLTLDKDGVVTDVIWNGIGFAADIVNGAKIVAVNGRDYSAERMKEAITLAKTSGTLDLLIARGGRYRSVTLNYKDGLRYPHLVKNGNSEGLIDRLLKPISG
jgi:predicted metalloprotease with PDZ domain